jgi:hypothetical protein
MQPWKRFLLIGAGLGCGFAVAGAAIIGSWLWYSSFPHAPKPWNKKAIVATYDYSDTEKVPPFQPRVAKAAVLFTPR